MRSPSMSSLFGSSSSECPPDDLHSKMQAATPYRSKTDTMNSVVRTFSASKALSQILGMREPEPFVTPPVVPSDLEERFETGLKAYEKLYVACAFASRHNDSSTTSLAPQQRNGALADILEEKESPVRAAQAQNRTARASGNLEIDVPKWTSGKQAVAAAQRYTLLDNDSNEADQSVSQQTHHEFDEDFGSSTALAGSDYSQLETAQGGPPLPQPSFPPRTSSLLPLPGLNTDVTTSSSLLHSASMRLQPGSGPVSTRHVSSVPLQGSNEEDCSYPDVNPSSLARSASCPVLFPSPGVAFTPGESVSTETTQEHTSIHCKADGTVEDSSTMQEIVSPPTPRITIQAPSPVKPITSRKRAPSSTNHQDGGPPLAQRSRRDTTSGLPLLADQARSSGVQDFPGETHALLTILLTWSNTMWTLYHRLHDPKLFSIHSAFAYPITPPVRKQLLSVSFYDTSISPHKEIRFLGSGDVAELSYHEVDVFQDPDSTTPDPPSPRSHTPIEAIQQTLGLSSKNPHPHIRYMSMAQRANTGQGRWCYILIKAHPPTDGSTPPHLMLAWPSTAITSTSDCLHIIPTAADDDEPYHSTRFTAHPTRVPAPPHSKPARSPRTPAKSLFQDSLRAASSAPTLASGEAHTAAPRGGDVVLHRTVLKLEKAGFIPLSEEYRVDGAGFRGFVEACGRGGGKVILWRERERDGWVSGLG